MAARVFTAFGHGAFFGIGSVVAASLVPRNKRASAMAMMFAGLTLSNILGVPAGTALGEAFGWRSTFFAVVGIGLISVAAIAWLVPSNVAEPSGGGLRGELRVLGKLQVWLAMLIAVAGLGQPVCRLHLHQALPHRRLRPVDLGGHLGAAAVRRRHDHRQHHRRPAGRLETDADGDRHAAC